MTSADRQPRAAARDDEIPVEFYGLKRGTVTVLCKLTVDGSAGTVAKQEAAV